MKSETKRRLFKSACGINMPTPPPPEALDEHDVALPSYPVYQFTV